MWERERERGGSTYLFDIVDEFGRDVRKGFTRWTRCGVTVCGARLEDLEMSGG